MRVLISGSYRSSFLRAFKEITQEVDTFDDEEIYRQQLDHFKNRYTHRLFWKAFSFFLQRQFLRVVKERRPSLILVLKGWFFSPGLLAEIKKEFPETLLFCFNPDNPFNTWHFASSNPWVRKSVSLYDVYFIWSRVLIKKLSECAVKRVEYLPFGYDPVLHYPVEVSAEEKLLYANDIVFVGNWDEEREYWLKNLVDFDFGIWGEDYWLRRCKDKRLKNKYRGKVEHGERVSRILNASKISLNILRKQNKGSHNMRTFEAPACGAFVLAERSPEAREFFAEDKEAAYFSSPQELREKAKYYLEHEEEKRAIAQAGYQRCILSSYSYLDRSKRILEVYEEMKK